MLEGGLGLRLPGMSLVVVLLSMVRSCFGCVVEAELAASELRTNAVLHAEGADIYEVRISLDGRSGDRSRSHCHQCDEAREWRAWQRD